MEVSFGRSLREQDTDYYCNIDKTVLVLEWRAITAGCSGGSIA